VRRLICTGCDLAEIKAEVYIRSWDLHFFWDRIRILFQDRYSMRSERPELGLYGVIDGFVIPDAARGFGRTVWNAVPERTFNTRF